MKRVWGRTDSLNFKLFHKQVGNCEANGGTHGRTMDLFIILTLQEELCVFEAKLQQGDYLRDGNASPLGEWVLLKFIFDYNNGGVHGY